MRKYISILSLMMISITGNAQSTSNNTPTALGLPGDNLNLYLVLNLFKQSSSVEDFEKQLNNPATNVNNLDLNNDGYTDYLRVIDNGKGDYHTLVIQDPVTANETQDVAIIDIQKNNGNMAHIQIIGDESLYGKDYIIEPQIENANKQASQPTTVVNNNNYYVNSGPEPYVNVWGWPSINFIFGVSYSPWISPWYYSYYPHWWNPWPRVHYPIYCAHFTGFGWGNYYRSPHYVNHVYYNNYRTGQRKVSNTVQVNITKNVYHTNNYNNTNSKPYNNPNKGDGVINNTNVNTNTSGNKPQGPKKDNNWGKANNNNSNSNNGQTYNPEKNNNTNGNYSQEPKKNNWGGMNNGNNGQINNPSKSNQIPGNSDGPKKESGNWGGMNNNGSTANPTKNNPVQTGEQPKKNDGGNWGNSTPKNQGSGNDGNWGKNNSNSGQTYNPNKRDNSGPKNWSNNNSQGPKMNNNGGGKQQGGGGKRK